MDTTNFTTIVIDSFYMDILVKYDPPMVVNLSFAMHSHVELGVSKALSIHPKLQVDAIIDDVLGPLPDNAAITAV